MTTCVQTGPSCPADCGPCGLHCCLQTGLETSDVGRQRTPPSLTTPSREGTPRGPPVLWQHQGSAVLPNSGGFFPDTVTSRPFTAHTDVPLKAGWPRRRLCRKPASKPGSHGRGGAGGGKPAWSRDGPATRPLPASHQLCQVHPVTHGSGVQGQQRGRLGPVLPGLRLWCCSGSLTKPGVPEGGYLPSQNGARCPRHNGNPATVR